MADVRVCPQCGADLPAGSPAGLCARCRTQQTIDYDRGTPRATPHDPTLAPRSSDPTDPVRPGEGRSFSGARYFGDYEILEEIARGGMGVVYKARQVSLDRIVALKMILAGQLASESDVERFYTEARAAATLQHANIVAIHEVGQREGHHYFSMDYVEGKSLASLVEKGPLPVERAVAYLKRIAEAIHYAHQHGILHRDLKPSNILIDSFDQPRVTDFGIAKRLGGGDVAAVAGAEGPAGAGSLAPSLTAAGEVLGTPSYMPPEQIDADPTQLGPASDVYALGAVLYELLTGGPPFKANSVRDTLLLVIQSPPRAVRRLNRRVPSALEQICLKCLQKDPNRRYPSAAALADDLARFELGQKTLAAADYKAVAPRIIVGSLLACVLFCCGGPVLVLEAFPKLFGFKESPTEGLASALESMGVAVETGVRKAQQLEKLARSWHPPADVSHPEDVFPKRVGSYTLAQGDTNAAIPEFRIDLPGARAIYKSGPITIEFFIYRAKKPESDHIFSLVNTSFNDKKVRVEGFHTVHYAYKFAGQMRMGSLLWAANRLLLARTTQSADGNPAEEKLDDFVINYLETPAPPPALAQRPGHPVATAPDEDDLASEAESNGLHVSSFVFLGIVVIAVAGLWRVFLKAGLPGWGALIPFYNLALWMRLGGKPGWWAIWLFVPLLNFVIYTIVTFEVAKNFGKGVAYTLGLLLFPTVFYAFLGFGRARYNPMLLRLRRQAAGK